MRERSDLVSDSSGRLMAGATLDWESLPARVDAVIGERVARLTQNEREILHAASVEGEEFGAQIVARVLDMDRDTVVRSLSILDRDHHLVRATGVRGQGSERIARYRFRHFLIQRYIWNRSTRRNRCS